MATADQLLKEIYSLIEQRELCAKQLKKLAGELESLRKNCNAGECAGSTMSVAGAACLIGAGLATLCTGGAAAPALGWLGGAYTGVGLTVSLTSKLTEHLSSSDTMKEAQKIEEKSNDVGKKIQRLFQKLKAESSSTDPDEQDQYVITEIVEAVARRSGLKLPNNISTFGGFEGARGFDPRYGMLSFSGTGPVMTSVVGVLLCLSFPAEGKASKHLFAEGVEQLTKKATSAGFKSFLKGGGMVVGGAVVMAFALPEAINSWTEMIKNNHVTEASKSVRDTADSILEMTRTLKEQLDNIKETVERLARVQQAVENSNRSRYQKKLMIEFVIENSEDETVKQWLRYNSESEAFFHLVDMFVYLEKHIEKEVTLEKHIEKEVTLEKHIEEEEKKVNINIDIIIVAHGCIEDPMIPASCLLPSPSIRDVILYSPWNCLINADVAYGVATGRIKPEHRVFNCANEYCRLPHEWHRPTNLPDGWNSMKNAGDQKIPNIMLSSLNPPKDGAWERFVFLQERYGQPGRNRVVIPFILPEGLRSSVRVPFFVIMRALSLVLLFFEIKATVHLAACLDKTQGASLDEEYLKQQYACTIDDTGMHSSLNLDDVDEDLYRDLKAVFG